MNLTCARLSGSGNIWADSYCQKSKSNCPGGGGRVAIRLTDQETLTPFTGEVTAYGSYNTDEQKTYGAPGTYYLETKSDPPGGGVVIVQDKKGALGALDAATNLTDIPSTRLNPDEPDAGHRLFALPVRDGQRVVVGCASRRTVLAHDG